MRSWALIPHFYQPPTQSLILTEQILRSCYLPFLDNLLAHPKVEMSLNLSASLILQLERIPNHDFFPKIKQLVQQNQIEFLDSAIFHPILPLTPSGVILRQIKENSTIIERFTGQKPVSGFFPPELAIDQNTLDLLSKNNFDFTLVDESSIDSHFDLNRIASKQVLNLKNPQIKLLVSSRSLTEILRSFPTELKAENLIGFIDQQLATRDQQFLVCTTDVEVFGHHYTERRELLNELFQSSSLNFVKTTSVLNQQEQTEVDNFTPSSWQTSKEELKAGIPFALWNNPKNVLQTKYQQLANLAYKSLSQVESETSIENHSHVVHSAQHYFDQGISSCHSYWLSNTPWWHPDMVELGAGNLIRCIRTLPIPLEQKAQAENFYHNFMLEVWSFHWSGKVEENYALFEKTRIAKLSDLPKI